LTDPWAREKSRLHFVRQVLKYRFMMTILPQMNETKIGSEKWGNGDGLF
jgi:hypothetical protein